MSVERSSIETVPHDHVVQFYDDDAALISAAGSYLVESVAGEGAAIVIATGPHRQAFCAALEAAGIERDEAVAAGRLVLLDAAETLAAFRSGMEIDRARFHEVIGGVVRTALRCGRPVHAYGEMVALLWQAGDVLAALELERLWNDLGRELPFSLYCAYPAASVTAPDQAESLRRVCELHSAVVPTVVVAADHPAEPEAPGAARRAVVAALQEAGLEGDVIDNAALVVTELATNAVVHAGTPFSLAVSVRGSIVRIAVSDAARRDAALVVRPSHGLAIIETLAERWGVDQTDDGKVVWAELPA